MLKNLSIDNYALIDKLSIDFSSGFTVITGETGAGKSILLGALGLLLGKRADPNVLMDKSRKCIVEGSFHVRDLDLESFFHANDLDYHSLAVLRREIIPSGRSRAFINDTPVNLDLLKKLGEHLLDIHSQHQTLLLNSLQFQMDALDGYINQDEWLKNYRAYFQQYEANSKHLGQLISAEKEAKLNEDYIQFQYNELESANLNAEATEELIEKEKFHSHAEEVIREVSQTNKTLSEEDRSAIRLISDAINSFLRIARFYPPIQGLLERLQTTQIELKDIASEVESTLNKIDFNPNELQEITKQLDTIYRLQQKFSVQTVEELIAIRDDFSEKLGHTLSLEKEIEATKEKNTALFKEVERLGKILHDNRKKHAILFEKSTTKVLIQMGMKDATFDVRVQKLDQYSENGCNKVQFLFNANKGGTPGEISKIASGGELSRLMLAIKSLVSKENFLPTVIFDEIDAGVSGEIAAKVGSILQNMAKRHQLIVISHLPQIAAKARTHLLVSKMTDDKLTRTQINTLDTNGRVNEIAKMMSDENVSQSAIKTAKELLKQPA